MELPNLPTDNLYKFRALAGLTIILFFISVFVIRLGRIDENLDKMSLEIGELKFEKILIEEKDSLLSLEVKQLAKSFERYKTDSLDTIIQIDNLIKDLHDPAHREYLTFLYTFQDEIIPEKKILADLEQRLNLREENRILLRSKTNTLNIKNEILTSDLKSLQRFSLLMSLGIGVGAYIAISGFRLWYNRVQKFLDIELENDLQSIKNKNKT